MPKADPQLTVFGRRIATMRRVAKLTQEKLAERSDLSTNFISEIERGIANPSLTVLRKLATGLGTTAAVLLDDDAEESRQIAAVLNSRPKRERQIAVRLVRALVVE